MVVIIERPSLSSRLGPESFHESFMLQKFNANQKTFKRSVEQELIHKTAI